MKNIVSILIFIFATSSVLAQKLYTRNDSIIITQDSVTIKAGYHRGNIQWQKSFDGNNWINLEGKLSDSVKIKSDIEAIYRAKITEGTCLPVYSDTVAVISADTITINSVDPVRIGLQLISDTTDISEGNYIYTGDTKTNDFEIGKVLIDEQSGGTIGRITDVIQQGDTTSVTTVQATLEDLFQDTSFKLSTNMVYLSEDLKSASLLSIEKALTDKDGYIHPLEVIDESTDGIKLKSASAFYLPQNMQGGTMYINEDFSEKTIFKESGSFSYKSPEGNFYTYKGDCKATIKEGHFIFDPELKFDFEFDRPAIDWENISLKKGKIKMFKFYSDQSLVDVKSILSVESNIAFKYGKDLTLINKIVNKKFKFVVGGVPIWVQVRIDLKCKATINLVDQGTISNFGFKSTNHFTMGAIFENNTWRTIQNTDKYYEVIVPNSNYENKQIQFEIYPSLKVKFYAVLGPFLDVAPYINYHQTSSSIQNWDKGIDFGVLGRVGVLAELLGHGVLSYTPLEWNFFTPISLYSSPANLELVSGNNQSGQTENQLPEPVIVKVTNSKDQPVENVQVYFFPLTGAMLQPIVVKTDAEGIAQTSWTLSTNFGEQSLKVYLLDGKDQEIDGCSLTLKATATNAIATKPTLTTSAITSITQTTATSGGIITSDGGAPVTTSGICWSTSQDPTTAKDFTTDGNTSSFTSNLTGLTDNTTYYVWAYAINSAGTGYGNKVSFTTATAATIETGTVTDIDGNVYQTVKIGDQWWMAENLKTTKYNDGTSIPNVTDNTAWSVLTTGAYCWYNNDASYKTPYGALYNWYSVNTGKLAPTGWHVPSDAEWTTLTDYLGGQDGAGYKLKESGYTHWLSSIIDVSTNETGFTALPGGGRWYDYGQFVDIGGSGRWWSSEQVYTNFAWERYMYFGDGSVGRHYANKEIGFSVRCIKGDITASIVAPTLTTNPITAITQTTATSGGNITSNGGAIITASGICWSTSQDPTTATNFTTDGNSGNFSSNLSGLIANTTYYVWAYATNSAGTGYGNKESFTTAATIETGTVTDIDGNVYHTVTIGTQTWMVENLKTTKYNDGTSIPNVTVNYVWAGLASGAYCWYENNASYKNQYGALYNWYAVNTGKLAPIGWHVSTDAEWSLLINFLGGDVAAGGELKETGTTHWSGPNTGATNNSGFSALPGGYRQFGIFNGIAGVGNWWSSSENDSYNASLYYLHYLNGDAKNQNNSKDIGNSVRCVKD